MLICFMTFNAEEIEQFRKDTAGTSRVIHLNNAGAALPPNEVRDVVLEYLKEEALVGGYELSRQRSKELEETYAVIARLISAKPSEIALVENATAAWQAAFYSIDWKPGDELICNRSDYASNYLSYLHHPSKPKVHVLPNDQQGDVDLEALKSSIGPRTRLVSITHMPTNSGQLAPAEEIGVLCKEKGVFYLLDACQTVGQYPLDVNQLHCNFLSATGRKYLRGPRGTGFLYVREATMPKIRPYVVDLHSAEWIGEADYEVKASAQKFENWEGNRATQLGLKQAAAYAMHIGVPKIWQRITELAAYTRIKMADLPHVSCHDLGTQLGGIVSFTVRGYSADAVMQALAQQRINVSWNGRSNTYLDMTEKGLEEIVRCSVHYYNTEEEIDQFIDALKKFGK